MGYCAVGSMSPADWSEIKKLCNQVKREFNEKLEKLEQQLESEIADLDTKKIKAIINDVEALNIEVSTIIGGQKAQDKRLDNLEKNCANLEITTSEVLEAYIGA